MNDPSLPVQVGVMAALNVAGVQALVGTRIWDRVPTGEAGATYPYASLGPSQIVPDLNPCGDQIELYQQIDWWSRAVGSVEAKSIGAAVCAALAENITVAGFRVVTQTIERVDYRRQPDGLTTMGSLSLYLSLVPTS